MGGSGAAGIGKTPITQQYVRLYRVFSGAAGHGRKSSAIVEDRAQAYPKAR